MTKLDLDKTTRKLFVEAEGFRRFIKREKWSSLVDVGCGSGIHAADFATTGRTVWALDLNDNEAARNLAREFDFVFTVGNWRDVLPKLKVDAVYSHHVLEHLTNPLETLVSWVGCVPMGGLVAIVAPINQHGVARSGHISMGWSTIQLSFLLALAGCDCRSGRFAEGRHSVGGYGFRCGPPIDYPYLLSECDKRLPRGIEKIDSCTYHCLESEVNWK